MPPKRKASSQTRNNTQPAKTRKQTRKTACPKDDVENEIKYPPSNPTSPNSESNPPSPKPLSRTPSFQNLEWPNIDTYLTDSDSALDLPPTSYVPDSFLFRVSDVGFPVSDPGVEESEYLTSEAEKRDQESRDLCLYGDWNGWGLGEVMENYLGRFDSVVREKEGVWRMWGFVEGLACFLKADEEFVEDLVGNENGESVKEILDMLGTMVLTALDTLSSQSLLKSDSKVKNIPIVCLILIEFINGYAKAFGCEWAEEVLGICDENGIKLEEHVRRQVEVSKKKLGDMRRSYKGRERVNKKWKKEFQMFKKDHPGGTKYDLSKKSKLQLKRMGATQGIKMYKV